MEGKKNSLIEKGKKLVLTGSKIKFVCFLAVYMLLSDFLPVSFLCISRALAILMCSLSHVPIKMDQSGS